MTRWLAASLAACALAPACTLDAGQGFATMKGGELEVALLASEARDLGDGAFLTDQGYRVMPREISVRVERLVLLERSAERASEPPELSLCHGDHCHAADGSLVERDSAEAGDGAGYEPVVEAHVDRAFDVVLGERAVLEDFEPSAELPEGSIDRLEIELTELRVRADIEGGDLAGPAVLEIDLPLGAPLAKAVSLTLGRDGPDEIALHVSVHLDATALDGIELAARTEGGAVAIDGDGPEAEALIEWLARSEIDVTF